MYKIIFWIGCCILFAVLVQIYKKKNSLKQKIREILIFTFMSGGFILFLSDYPQYSQHQSLIGEKKNVAQKIYETECFLNSLQTSIKGICQRGHNISIPPMKILPDYQIDEGEEYNSISSSRYEIDEFDRYINQISEKLGDTYFLSVKINRYKDKKEYLYDLEDREKILLRKIRYIENSRWTIWVPKYIE